MVPIMSTGRDFFLWFNSTIAFAIGVLGISRAFLVKLLRLCTIYHSLTCVMFQILVQRGYSWRQLSLCWAAIKDNISYLLKKRRSRRRKACKSIETTKRVVIHSSLFIWTSHNVSKLNPRETWVHWHVVLLDQIHENMFLHCIV